MSNNNMQNDLERILTQLASRKKGTSVQMLDEDLLNPGKEHSDLFDLFIDNQKLSLSQTMASLITDETDNGRLMIEGYKENYFNEIIQNINDLKIKVRDDKDTTVDISVDKKDGKYILSCEYRDDGFRARDLYGFCNMGKGAKREDDDGKFGIGIKAILTATSSFEVKSNLIIRYSKDDGSVSILENADWNQNNRYTYARYEIPIPDETGEVNGIHVGKLEDIVNLSNPEIVFGDTSYNKVVFDFRSLLFMKRIQTIKINDWILKCEGDGSVGAEEAGGNAPYSIKHVLVCKPGETEPVLSERYLYLCPDKEKDGKMSFAFLLNPTESGRKVPNRLYSVYYIRRLEDTIKPLGILINTDHVNSFRNEIASTEEEIKRIKNDLKDSVAKTVASWTEYSFDNAEIQKAVSEVFFRCLLAYWKDIEEGLKADGGDNHSKLDEVFGLFNYVLEKGSTVENLQKICSEDRCAQKYVVCKEDKEEYEEYIQGIEDESIVDKTNKLYLDVFENNEVISYSQIQDNGINSDVKEVYKRVKETDSEALIHMLSWFGNVSDYIKYKILDDKRCVDGISVEEVVAFIREFEKEHKDEIAILYRILGRYKIIELFSETGRVKPDKVNFIEYLFLDDNKDDLQGEIFKIYDNNYLRIKNRLRENLCLISYDVPRSYSRGPFVRDGSYYPTKISDVKNESDVELDNSDVDLLLDIIEKQKLYGYFRYVRYDKIYIFNKLVENKKFENRNVGGYTYYDRNELRGINFTNVINHSSLSIDEFITHQHIIDRIINRAKEGIYGIGYLKESLIKVKECEIHVSKLSNLITWMVNFINKNEKFSSLYFQTIEIDSVEISNSNNECGADYIEFVENITRGSENKIKDIYLKQLETDNRGAKTVAYIGAGKNLNVRLRKTDRQFIPYNECKIKQDDSRLYVFYANQPKEEALSVVIDNLDLGSDITEQIKGYISMAEIGHSVSSYEYEKRLQLNKNSDKAVIPDGMEISKQEKLSVFEKKKLFMARGSYNGCCPVCGKSLLGEDNDLDKAAENSSLYTIKLKDGSFFQSCCCSGCLAILRKTFMGAELSGNWLKIKQTIVSGEKETSDNEIQIQLSNINMTLRGIDT